jgi:hypothetical protein
MKYKIMKIPELIIVDDTRVSNKPDTKSLAKLEAMTARIRRLEDIVGSIYFRVQDIRAIYAFNRDRGVQFYEMGPHDAPLNYKLDQLNGDVTALRSAFGLDPEEIEEPKKEIGHQR